MAVGSDTAMAAQERIATPQQQADLARLVRSLPCAAGFRPRRRNDALRLRRRDARHAPNRDLARSALPDAPVEADRTRRETDLLDHLRQVQRKEQEFTEAHQQTRRAHRHAGWVLWSAGIGLLLAVIALATG